MSHGLNLQDKCFTVIWVGIPWSYELFMQTIGRIYRQGQTHDVTILMILMRDTLDISVYEAIRRKKRSQEQFLGFLQEEIRRRRRA